MLDDLYTETGPERVGFILNCGDIVEVQNVAEDPELGFIVRPEDLLIYEETAIATWHTHPGESANLSMDDYQGFMSWPHLNHYVIGNDGVRCFSIKEGALVEV